MLLEQEFHAFRVLLAHATGTFHGDAEFELDVADGYPELLGMLETIGKRRGLEQRFRRNASPEDAGPPQRLTLDDSGRETELCTTNGAYVSGGTAADEDHVERGHKPDVPRRVRATTARKRPMAPKHTSDCGLRTTDYGLRTANEESAAGTRLLAAHTSSQ